MKIDREEARLNMQSTILCGGSITTMTLQGGWKKTWYRHNLIDVLADSLSGNIARELGFALTEYYKGGRRVWNGNLSKALEKAVEAYCSDDSRIDEYIEALEDERLDNIAREKFEDELAERQR